MQNFSEIFPTLPIHELVEQSMRGSAGVADAPLARKRATTLGEFANLLAPAVGEQHIEAMAGASQAVTQKHFGKTIRLFAPLYLSNECINNCTYCGFSRDNDIPRITIPIEQVVTETKKLAAQGHRALLLVAGEHPKYVSNGYVEECIRRCLPIMPAISLELGPMETEPYKPLVAAGCEGLVAYQETYHPETYKAMHTAGPKKNYSWRMDCPERAYHAGFRRLGIGALFGLYDWRYEAIAVAAHARHLLQNCWKATVSISMPRMRPAAGGFQPDTKYMMSDRDLVQLICAFRLFLPHVQLVLSTREPQHLRNGLIPVGVTTMSAGACTEPGGYSHFDESNWSNQQEQPGEQFHIADERAPKQVAEVIRKQGYEPVWKDFDQSLVAQ